MTGEFIWVFFTPPPCCRSLGAVCQQDMFVNQPCLALERWYYLSHMCPTANKPVSLSMSSYVTEGRAEEWQPAALWPLKAHVCQGNWPLRQLRWARQIGFVSIVYNYPTKRQASNQFQCLTWLRERPADRGSLWRWPMWRQTLQHKIKLLPNQTFTSTTKGLKSKEAV